MSPRHRGEARAWYIDPDGVRHWAYITSCRGVGERSTDLDDPTYAAYEYDLVLDDGTTLTGVPIKTGDTWTVEHWRDRPAREYLTKTHPGLTPPMFAHSAIEAVETVDVAARVFRNCAEDGTTPEHWYADPTPVDLLDALSLCDSARHEVDRHERSLIENARAKGVTWQAIGIALGSPVDVARQRAQRRYRALGGNPQQAVPAQPEQEKDSGSVEA